MALPLLAAACSFQALSFYFDGVPPPGSDQETEEVPLGPGGRPVLPAEATPKRTGSGHPMPDGCKGCHVKRTLKLRVTPEEGLCVSCHETLTADLQHAHGPVVAKACVICHDPHRSKQDHLLKRPPVELCMQCHEEGDLGSGDHHATNPRVDCLECHGGHGGENRFFLKQDGDQ